MARGVSAAHRERGRTPSAPLCSHIPWKPVKVCSSSETSREIRMLKKQR
nr:MAG TPA: hypothetical protein [Caudoviricetes sp.]